MEKFVLSDIEKKFLGYFIDPSDHYYTTNLSTDSPVIYFLDCEMVETVDGPQIVSIGIGTETSRISIKVKPNSEVTNYITEITGCTKDTEYDMTFDELISFLKKKLTIDDILLGHHMYQDLALLNWYQKSVIDTSMLFHHPDGPPHYYSLKTLVKQYLHKTIQSGIHDPIEDGLSAYELVKYSADNGYIKTEWAHIGELFVPSVELVIDCLKTNYDNIHCIYTRGSRAIGTNSLDSDYDLVVVCDEKCKVINGTLTKYGNIDLCVYDQKCFEKYLREQIIWALECIYCPPDQIYLEKIDFRKYVETYRTFHEISCNESLKNSIGYESSRKVSSSKRHFLNGNIHQSKKHAFIATRFVDYGRQIVKLGKIENLQNMNHLWEILKHIEEVELDKFNLHWKPTYVQIYREFSKYIPRTKKIEVDDYYGFNDNQKIYKNLLNTKKCTSDLSDEIWSDNDKNHTEILADLIKLLQKEDGEDILKSKYAICIYESTKHPDLILLRYTNKTPNCKFKHICRGLILDKSKNYNVVAYPMNNFIERSVDDLSKESNIQSIYEKIDGSFVCMYNYNGTWKISSSRNPDGDGIIGIRKQKKIVFSDLFWTIFEEKKYDLTMFNPDFTYMFEMVSPDHPIIISYEKNNIVLIGIRNNVTHDEINIMDPIFNIFDKPKTYTDFNIDNLDPLLQEGYVIVLNDFRRIKLKTSDYVKRTFMFPLCTNRLALNINMHILKVIQAGEEIEFSRYCPEYTSVLRNVKEIYNNFIAKIRSLHGETYIENMSRKDYAASILKYDRIFHKYLFVMYENKNIDAFISSLTTKRIYNDMFLKVPVERNVATFAPIPRAEWKIYQIEKSTKVITVDTIDMKDVKYVGGLDISFDKIDDSKGCAYITVYDVTKRQIVYEDYRICTLTVPYVSGFLGFRETSEYVELLRKIKKDKPEFYPQVLMIDGFGILHHRGFGSASHLGYIADIPTIGVAKTLLYVDGLDETDIKSKFRTTCKDVGSYIELVGDSGKIYGVGFKSAKDALNPLYISVGHKISLESAIDLVSKTCIHRIPEPIRNSDIKSKLFL